MRARFVVGWAILFALSGCGSVIPKQIREEAVPIRGLAEVRDNPEAFKGRTVILGGEIIETRNQADKTILLVLDRPLGYRDRPDTSTPSDGRFMATVSKYLDPAVFARGQPVTVAGVVVGTVTEPVGQAPYRYVALEAREIYLWQETPDYRFYYCPAGSYYGPSRDRPDGNRWDWQY